MKTTTSKNSSLRRSEYFRTPKEFFLLKQYYLNKLDCLQDGPDKDYMIQHCEKLLDDLNFNLSAVMPLDSLSNLIVPVVGHCNLNCRYCTSYSPVSKKEFYDPSSILEDLAKVKSLGFDVREISIEGGEPLLHPDLIEIATGIHNMFPSTIIVILTNGIELKRLNIDFLKELKNVNCQIIIDRYFEDMDFSEFVDIANSIGLIYEIIDCFSKDGYFFKARLKDLNNESSIEDRFKAFAACEKGNRCVTLVDHKLYTCGPAAYVYRLNNHFNTNYPDSGIDIYNNSRQDIIRFLSKPCRLCGFCQPLEDTGNNYKLSEKNIDEWISK